ncbi:acetoacetate decarboxylase family protein [Clostridium estertheticum]|nr:acetoacetate decarboxylase family protein [Clostridium estertheticum]MBU3183496.1 acetoacetate decarboxylase family protein [Clostridium estertheticum]MBZ9614953.1 acetoacetate decarboxylase family protein [Clostridium estertheticum subsp. laramiense]MPQ30317.1 acetoacetate decarboxylase [Clostridium estertheticum]MPQ60993.1 acetoacetate decarboxylase [Clostridium estertheticum]WAG74860.1 acetoacetate decarboxylase family protein [Clostridium estertheticum]
MNSFIKDPNDIKKYCSKPTTFYNAQMLTAYWETKPEIIARLLPAPLKPAKRPLVSAFVANYPRTNFCAAYKETALLILADYNGQIGTYCISMQVSDGMAMALGREIYGFPKKLAEIKFKREGDTVNGSVSRNGIEFFSLKANLNEKFNDIDGKKIIGDNYGNILPIYNYKYSKSPDGSGFDLKPRLIEQGETMDTTLFKNGEVEMNLKDSPHDPWAELEVVKMLGCTYTEGTTVLLRGKVLEEVDPMAFIPYSNTRWDWWEDTL